MLFGLSPVALGGPGKDKPSQKAPQPKPAPNPPPANVDDKGVMTSMKVSESGEILSITVYIASKDRNEFLRGCGAKLADHPLLMWAFESRRAVTFTFDTSTTCLVNYSVTAPTS